MNVYRIVTEPANTIWIKQENLESIPKLIGERQGLKFHEPTFPLTKAIEALAETAGYFRCVLDTNDNFK